MNNIKNNVYYYIENLIKSTDDKHNKFYIFEIKMKFIKFNYIEDFEFYLKSEKKYVKFNKFKINLINDIINTIKKEKQKACVHNFSHLKKITNNNFSETEWKMKCVFCKINTNEIGIKIGCDNNNNFPSENDLFKLFELCDINGWNVK